MPLLPHRLSVRNTCTLICPSLANTFQTLTVRLPLLRQNGSALWENIQAILIAVLIALFIRTFIVQAFKIPSGSMLPTLQIGDHILVNKFIYGVKLPFTGTTVIPVSEPAVNDVIVFEYPVDLRPWPKAPCRARLCHCSRRGTAQPRAYGTGIPPTECLPGKSTG